MIKKLILLLTIYRIIQVANSTQESIQFPQEDFTTSLGIDEIVDDQTGPLQTVVDGETLTTNSILKEPSNENNTQSLNSKTEGIRQKFLELYFTYKASTKKVQTSGSKPLGLDLFDDSTAQFSSSFPQPKIIKSIRLKDGEFSAISFDRNNENFNSTSSTTTTPQQFDQNSSDIELQSTKKSLKLTTTPKSITTNELFFENETRIDEEDKLDLVTTTPKINIISNKKQSVTKGSPPACSDTAADCPERKNLCDSPKYGEIMWRMCPYTCDACFKKTTSPTCVDASPLCGKKRNYCTISYFQSIMHRVCPKTCKSC